MDENKPSCLPASPSANQLIMLVIVVMRLWRVLICWPGKPVLAATFINNSIDHTSTVGYFGPSSTCIQMMQPQRSCHFTCSGKLPLHDCTFCPRDDLFTSLVFGTSLILWAWFTVKIRLLEIIMTRLIL